MNGELRTRIKNEREPLVCVRNAQRSVKIRTSCLQSFGQAAARVVWKHKRPGSSIRSLRIISVTIISDRAMAKVHKQFSGISGPTDVLTFQHGEIIISAQTAARQARQFHRTLEDELRLYQLHGLLHLCGFDDSSPAARAVMHKVQDKLMRVALAEERERARCGSV